TTATNVMIQGVLYSFNVGDIVVGVEDLARLCVKAKPGVPCDGNVTQLPGYLAFGGDFDFNDMVFVAHPVPEPATMALLSAAGAFAAFRRRRRGQEEAVA